MDAVSYLDLPAHSNGVITAELIGDDQCAACGIEVRCSSPVIALCRQLTDAGADPRTSLEAYRGSVLCLRVRSIGEAAALEINGDGTGFRPARKADAASPMCRNGLGAA